MLPTSKEWTKPWAASATSKCRQLERMFKVSISSLLFILQTLQVNPPIWSMAQGQLQWSCIFPAALWATSLQWSCIIPAASWAASLHNAASELHHAPCSNPLPRAHLPQKHCPAHSRHRLIFILPASVPSLLPWKMPSFKLKFVKALMMPQRN